MSEHQPPKALVRFFKWYCRSPLQEAILGDLEEQYFEVPVEGYDDHFVVREVFPTASKDVDFDILHDEAQIPGDYYYLRVRQEDGGLVWSSPFRVE